MCAPTLVHPKLSLWHRIPLVVRAVFLGWLVTEAGLVPWSAVLVAPPRWMGVAAAPILLVLYWLFFSGRLFWPATMPARRENFRAVSLSPATWIWGLAAAGLFVIVMEASIFTLFRLIPFPAEQFTRPAMLEGLSNAELWMALVAASIFAGLFEETGFRGYMQRPLEKAYGPGVAIAVTTLAFAVLHLNQAWVFTLLVPIFLASVMLGLLAYVTQSLIPGIIGHAVMDVFNFAYWWWSLLGRYDRRPVFETGIDGDFLLWSLTLTVSLALFAMVLRCSHCETRARVSAR
jgi:membrane protease YdiL (CAAX protease family)